MPRLEQRLIGLADSRPPRGAGALIQRVENEVGGRRYSRPSTAVHPIRAMALAATAILVFVGGVAVGHWTFGSAGLFDAAFGPDSTWTTKSDVAALATVVGGLSGGTILLIGALVLGRRWGRRPNTFRSWNQRGGVMDTIDRTTDGQAVAVSAARTNRWPAIGLVLALAALAGLGAWVLVDNLVVSDVERIAVDSIADFNSGERTVWIEAFSEDAVLTMVVGKSTDRIEGTSELFAWAQDAGSSNLQFEITGEPIVSGEYVLVPIEPSWTGAVGRIDHVGIQVFRLVDGRIVSTLLMTEKKTG